MRHDPLISILLVEAHADLRRVMRACLEQMNIRVLEAANVQSAKEILRGENPRALVVDYDFPRLLNGEIIEASRGRGNNQPAIIVTTTQRISDDWRDRYRPSAVVYKPFDIRLLLKTILTSIKERRGAQEALST
jgi:DNA-binding NtrC family response regulator